MGKPRISEAKIQEQDLEELARFAAAVRSCDFKKKFAEQAVNIDMENVDQEITLLVELHKQGGDKNGVMNGVKFDFVEILKTVDIPSEKDCNKMVTFY